MTCVASLMRTEMKSFLPNIAAPSPMLPYCVGRHHPSTVKPSVSSELGMTFPQEMPSPSLVRGTFMAEPILPATTDRLAVLCVPLKPFAVESSGSTESMCQTPLYPAQIFVDGIGVLAKGVP